jgi:HD superfamily phosphohydrolase YqeK
MQQRHKKDKTVKVCPYVPVRVRQTAERMAKRVMVKTKEPAFATPFIATWATLGHDIAVAADDAQVLRLVEQLRGKPLVLPAKDGAP